MSHEELISENDAADKGMIPAGRSPSAFEPSAGYRPSGRALPISKGNLLLAGAFAAGIVCIYILSLRGGPSQASAEQNETQTQVDNVLSKLAAAGAGGGISKKDQAGINTSYYEARHRQIDLSALRGNPFVFARSPADKPASRPENPVGAKVEPKAEESQDYTRALQEAQKLSLQTILTGSSGSTAMISNNLLTEGQTINGWTVSKIRPSEVVLTWKDKTYVLALP